MKIKIILAFSISVSLVVLFILFPSVLITSASKGIMLCYEIIIPSLFPFTVVSLFIFNCGIGDKLKSYLTPFSSPLTGLNGDCFFALLMSFIGGFPVGAKLINNSFKNGTINEKTANRMLSYSVNPGPAFVIIGIGEAIFKNASIGYILYASNILASVTICLLLSKYEKKTEKVTSNSKSNYKSLTDVFVNSVYESCQSILLISGYVVLFSTIIGLITETVKSKQINDIVALLEISNGTVLFSNNIYKLSFLTAFSGICVQMQIISLCSEFKTNYFSFLISKILSGLLSVVFTLVFVKVFNVSIPVMSFEKDFSFNLSAQSLVLSGALIFMSIVFLTTIKQKNIEKQKSM